MRSSIGILGYLYLFMFLLAFNACDSKSSTTKLVQSENVSFQLDHEYLTHDVVLQEPMSVFGPENLKIKMNLNLPDSNYLKSISMYAKLRDLKIQS